MKKIIKIALIAVLPSLFLALIIIGAVVTMTQQQKATVGGRTHQEEQESQHGLDAVGLIEAALGEVGTIGGDKYRAWYTGSADGEPWCATFVSWCANQAGLLDVVIPKFQSCKAGAAWFEEKGQLKYPSDYTPKTGDLIFFSWDYGSESGDIDHVGIVKAVEDGKIYTIEGNSGNSVRENIREMASESIYAYAVPAYLLQGGGTLPGGNNCEKVFRGLVEKGYTQEAAAGVVGNLMWESGGGPSDIKLNATESNGEGIGMVQWSFGRKEAFLKYCDDIGVGWPNENLEVQFNYLLWELESGNEWIWPRYGDDYGADCNISMEEFKQCTDVELATRAFCAKFERCTYHISALSTRITYAYNVYSSYAD